jgi:hypothetical protein
MRILLCNSEINFKLFDFTIFMIDLPANSIAGGYHSSCGLKTALLLDLMGERGA